MTSAITNQLLALSFLPGIGKVSLKQLSKIDGIENLSINELIDVSKKIASTVEKHGLNIWDEAQQKRDQQLELAKQNNSQILSILDSEYPELLAETKDAPALLFIKGQLPNSDLNVAVIGTREPSEEGIKIARKATEHYIEKGAAIISGLARGCDSIAHQTAIDNKAYTMAILAHGLQTIKPTVNIKLAQQILDSGGALLSEYPFGTRAFRQYFVARDRIQAGISNGVVLIQSKIGGGSLHASRAIIEYGRWLEVAQRSDNSDVFDANDILLHGDENARYELFGKEIENPSLIREMPENYIVNKN